MDGVTPPTVDVSKYGRAVRLDCCVCGLGCLGRQWWNRDDGYGVCEGCIADARQRGESEAEIERLYGKPGIHHSLKPEPKT